MGVALVALLLLGHGHGGHEGGHTQDRALLRRRAPPAPRGRATRRLRRRARQEAALRVGSLGRLRPRRRCLLPGLSRRGLGEDIGRPRKRHN